LLPDDYGAGCLELAYNLGIRGRYTIFKQLAGSGRSHIRAIENVFDPDWNSMQPTAPWFGLGPARPRQCFLGSDRDIRIELWIELFNPAQAGLCQFDR